jgi:hypothetical protein
MDATTSTTAPAKDALTSNDDAAIIAAWERREAAFVKARGLPDQPTRGAMTPEQAECWDIIDAAETEIFNAVACTPRGAELQLWTAAAYLLDSALFDGFEDEQHYYRADLEHFVSQGEKRDWGDRLLIAALSSIRAMQAPKVDTTAWDAALAEYQPIRKRWPEDFDEGEALPTAEAREAAYKGFRQRLPQYQAARDRFMTVPAPTISALAIKMGIADPVDDDHFELCRLDAERLAGGAA